MEQLAITPEPTQPFDDLVPIDAHGRGHRPDGKFLSNYEVEQIGSHQELIRSMAPDAYQGRHRAEETPELPAFSSAELERGAQEAIQGLPLLEQTESVQAYLPKRWEGLKRAWNKTKGLANKLGDHLAIEYNGYKLTPGENAKARLARIAMLAKPELGLRDDMNPVVRKAYANRLNTKFTKGDWAKFAAYEALTVPVVRSIGVLAIEGATRTIASKRERGGVQPGVVGNLNSRSKAWLDKYRQNNLNPIDRAKQSKAVRAVQSTRSDPFGF